MPRLALPRFHGSSVLVLALSMVGMLSTLPILGQPSLERSVSPRNSNYSIEVRLDAEAKTLQGRQVLRWRNITDTPATELRFHLYWNGWRNDASTWMIEQRRGGRGGRGGRGASKDEDAWGWIEVDSIQLDSGPGLLDQVVDLTRQARFEAPDDGNPEDRTVMVVPLPRPVEPEEEISLEMVWHSKIPRTVARTGFRGDYFFIAHWFPKLGVFEGEQGWNCHQFHSNTEFFSDYGVYDVQISVPQGWVVGATGRSVGRTEQSEGLAEGLEDGMVTERFLEEDVHGFAWTASPDFRVAESRFEEAGLPPVDLRLLYQPAHEDQVDRYFDATRAALRLYGSWYGAYPYGHLTVVDPAWRSGTGGMEYPTLFTGGSRWLSRADSGSPEGVTVHEAGHQFWYGLVGNNEFEEAWLDEGFNTYSTSRVLGETWQSFQEYGRFFDPPGAKWGAFIPIALRGQRAWPDRFTSRRLRYARVATREIQRTPTFRYWPATAGDISYSKTALWLATLERHLGWENLRQILSTFFERSRFQHPTAEDFYRVADEVQTARGGESLSWFFDQVVEDSVVFDYEVFRVDSRKQGIRGWVGDGEAMRFEGKVRDESSDQDTSGKPQEDSAAAAMSVGDEPPEPKASWHHEVGVRRNGKGVFPVEVLVVFEDGTELRQRWDGRAPWTLLSWESDSPISHCIVDPEAVLLLDVSRVNNSKHRKPDPQPAAMKWASKWMLWFQDRLQAFTLFV